MKDIRSIIDDFRAGHHEFEKGHLEGFEGNNPRRLMDEWLADAVEHEDIGHELAALHRLVRQQPEPVDG